MVGTETCDDGNSTDGIGCKSTCIGIITGYTCCCGSSTTSSKCNAICGDGLVMPVEFCDDGI